MNVALVRICSGVFLGKSVANLLKRFSHKSAIRFVFLGKFQKHFARLLKWILCVWFDGRDFKHSIEEYQIAIFHTKARLYLRETFPTIKPAIIQIRLKFSATVRAFYFGHNSLLVGSFIDDAGHG